MERGRLVIKYKGYQSSLFCPADAINSTKPMCSDALRHTTNEIMGYCSLEQNHKGDHHFHSQFSSTCFAVWSREPRPPIYKNRVDGLREEIRRMG
jgi:hypothetical protein